MMDDAASCASETARIGDVGIEGCCRLIFAAAEWVID